MYNIWTFQNWKWKVIFYIYIIQFSFLKEFSILYFDGGKIFFCQRKKKIKAYNIYTVEDFFQSSVSLLKIWLNITEPKVSPMTFCRVFPFHLMFNRDLIIVQTGCTITRVIPQVCSGNCKLNDILLTVSLNNYNLYQGCMKSCQYLCHFNELM